MYTKEKLEELLDNRHSLVMLASKQDLISALDIYKEADRLWIEFINNKGNYNLLLGKFL